MTTPIPGVGNQLPQPDPRGWLTFDQLPTALQNAEDTTAAADHDRVGPFGGKVDRPATPAETALLAHLGYDLNVLTEPLITMVSYPSPGVRRRRWLQLEGQS